MDVRGYTITETLYRGPRSSLYRATRDADRLPVVLKMLDPKASRPRDVERLRREYDTGARLDLQAIVRPIGLETHQGAPVLVLEDRGGRPLDALVAGRMDTETFLDLAFRIARAVADLHAQGVIHKDLKPQNILVDPSTMEVRLADLGLATRVPREQQAAGPPALIEGSLPYMSPEQTGRMNRVVDSRTDLYSLGVTFYQMLTGRLPFEGADPLEWVHCHVAREPASPSQSVPELPEAVSRIVLKLLAKMPDDRYQTANGLERDLARCLDAWRREQRIEPFALGEHDVPDRLQIPQKLYGREEQLSTLLAAFERVAGTRAPELVLIAGYSGIGKSSLVQELQKPIVERRGVFVAGKFDPYKRDVPYSTIVQAFRELVLDILIEGGERVAGWRERLQAALGANGQLIVDVIPQLELLIGRQPPVPELPPPEAQGRFQAVFRHFIGAFTREGPLTLFVDDLQWTDPGSLALLQGLVTHPDVRSLLVVGAYRDNEVTPSHPLSRAVEAARTAGAKVSDIVVGPLSGAHLAAFIGDTLHCGPEEVEPLAALVREKTGANPFFVVQFLTMLHREGLVAFDRSAGGWRWDVERIRAQGYTDNVVELVVGKLRHLSVETQEALELMACMGASVDSETLAAVCQRDPEIALRAALEEDLLVRLDGTYRFPHDRVREAAYALIPEGERAAAHLGIGRRLLARAAPGEIEDEIFEIVNQLNRGVELITSPEERERVAELDLVAGRRAKGSTAYASALSYLAAGSALLGAEVPGRRYDLAFALELHRAECEYLTGELDAAEERLATLSRRAESLTDIAAVTSAQCDLHTTRGHGDRAVEVFLEYMRRIGVTWPPHPTKEDVRREFELVWRQLGSRPIEALVQLPAMTDRTARATIDLMTWAHPPSQFFDENLGALVIGRMVNFSLEHGNSDASGLAYVWLGSLLGSLFGDYEAGYRFGKVGLELVERRGLLRFQSRVYVIFGALVVPHSRHVREGIPPIRRAYDTALEACDISYACYARNAFTTLLLAAGHPLDEVQRETEDALDFVQKAKFGMMIDIIESKLRLIRTLRGRTPDPCSADDAQGVEARFDRLLEIDRSRAIGVCWYFVRKLQERYYAGDHRSAIAAATRAEALLWTSPSFVEEAQFHLYAALARAARCDAAPEGERAAHREALAVHRKQLEVWARSCPENFRSRCALVAAEEARVDGRQLDAERLFEDAIGSARENGFVQIEALAYELASGFYRARGFDLFADAYLREARACYLRWGADGKVEQLERLHPHIVERAQPAPSATLAVRAEQLDLLSAVKASQTISGEIEIEKIVATLLQVVLEQGGARRGCLVLEHEGVLHVEAEASIEQTGLVTRILPSLPLEPSLLLPVSLVHYARVTREPVILDDVSAKPGKFASDPYFSRCRTRSALCLPILRGAELVGLLYLENRHVAGVFTHDRLTTLSLLASQAAISVENARLLLQERQARQRSAFLAETGVLLAESLDYEETLKRLSRRCVESLADWCVLDLVERGELRRLAGACRDPEREPLLEQLRRRYPARWDSPHPAARSLRAGEPLWIPVFTDELLRTMCMDEQHLDIVRGLGTRSAVAVPLVARGETLGVLSLISATPGRYGRADLELVKEVARRAASAIDNARLYREVQHADRRKSEFIAVLSHELRNPLAPIRTGLELVRRAPPGSPMVARAWEIMARQTQHISRLVDDLLDATRISRGKIELQRTRFDLLGAVRATCDDLRPLFEQGALTFQLDLPPGALWVEADATRVAQVVGNLLQNAAKFTPAGGTVAVNVSSAGGFAEISVRDTGMGMGPSEMERMFEPFAQAEQGLARSRGGLGLGLALAKGLVELHGGSIRARSDGPGRGSEFVVSLPVTEQ